VPLTTMTNKRPLLSRNIYFINACRILLLKCNKVDGELWDWEQQRETEGKNLGTGVNVTRMCAPLVEDDVEDFSLVNY